MKGKNQTSIQPFLNKLDIRKIEQVKKGKLKFLEVFQQIIEDGIIEFEHQHFVN